jgi:AraC-like DNA-binding protein
MHWASATHEEQQGFNESPFAQELQNFVGTCQVLSAEVALRERSLRDVAESLASALPRPRCSADFLLVRSIVVEFATHAIETSAPDRVDALRPLVCLNRPDEPLGETLVQCLSAVRIDDEEMPQNGSVHALRARRAMTVIRSRCTDPNLDAAAVAFEVRVSQRSLCMLLRAHFGVGFRTALRRARVTASHELLQQSTLSVKEIAFRVGYTSTSQFDRDFRRDCGTTPGQYRSAQCAVSVGRGLKTPPYNDRRSYS